MLIIVNYCEKLAVWAIVAVGAAAGAAIGGGVSGTARCALWCLALHREKLVGWAIVGVNVAAGAQQMEVGKVALL
jgi:hypothetical protein